MLQFIMRCYCKMMSIILPAENEQHSFDARLVCYRMYRRYILSFFLHLCANGGCTRRLLFRLLLSNDQTLGCGHSLRHGVCEPIGQNTVYDPHRPFNVRQWSSLNTDQVYNGPCLLMDPAILVYSPGVLRGTTVIQRPEHRYVNLWSHDQPIVSVASW